MGKLETWLLTAGILSFPSYVDGLGFARHQGNVVVAIDNREDLLAVSTLQIQSQEYSGRTAFVAKRNISILGFASLAENNTLSHLGLGQRRQRLIVALFAAHNVEILRKDFAFLDQLEAEEV